MALDTIGSIAIHIVESFDNLPAGVSGNMIEIVDMARQHVANYTGNTIGSNSIDSKFQPAILDFAKADAIDAAMGEGTFANIKIADLSITEGGADASKALRANGEFKLKTLGQKRRFARSIS